MSDPTHGLLNAMTPTATTLLGQLAAARGELAATRDLLAALVAKAGGDVTLTAYDLQRAPTGRDLVAVYVPDFDEHRLRIR